MPEDLKEKDTERYHKLEDLAYERDLYISDLMYILSLVLKKRVLKAVNKEDPVKKK